MYLPCRRAHVAESRPLSTERDTSATVGIPAASSAGLKVLTHGERSRVGGTEHVLESLGSGGHDLTPSVLLGATHRLGSARAS